MKELYSLIRTAAILIFAVLSFAFATEITVLGQRPIPTAVDRRVEHLNRQIMDDERENLNRDMKRGKNKEARHINAQKLEQVKKDFEELQARYNQIVLAMASKRNPDYDSILAAVAEINKSAARLKENLALPRPKADEEKTLQQGEAELTEIKKTILTLEKHIYSFVTNPLFEVPEVLDLELAAKARRDLDKIIELSENIKAFGDKLTIQPNR
ncbi:MAG: hypothetical protein M3209_05120 [Acidobacteriota bacterium]|nr:hypothetical protein [Acidobacteriota bacterium]